MKSVLSSTQLLYQNERLHERTNMDVDWTLSSLRHSLRRRWLIPATLAALLTAVAAPGGIQSEFVRYIPLSYIYFSAGRRHWTNVDPAPWRHLLLSVLHSHVVAPVTAAVICLCQSGVDYRIARGMVLSTLGAGCGWLSLAAAPSPPLVPLLGTQLAALIAKPVAMIVICGRATVPPLGSELRALLLVIPPYAIGMLSTNNNYFNIIQNKIHNLLKHFQTNKHISTSTSKSNVSTKYYAENDFITMTTDTDINSESRASINNNVSVTYKYNTKTNSPIIVDSMRSNENNNSETTYLLDNVSTEQFSTSTTTQQQQPVSETPFNLPETATTAAFNSNAVLKLCVGLLLYADFSDRLQEAEGSLMVGDVLGTMALVVCCVAASVTVCLSYQWLGLTSASGTRIVACVALPRCLDLGWQSSTQCVGWGLSRLAAVFAGPLQAMAVGALAAGSPAQRWE